MAQTYEIDIERFNGTDYDTLLPTPATHAATHQADGIDPLTCQTDNYGDKTVTGVKMADATVTATQLASDAVTTAKITDANVTRAKLANNALYSPITQISANRNITTTDLGCTLVPKWVSAGATYTLSLNATISSSLPVGFEVAILYIITNCKVNLSITGIRMVHMGDGQIGGISETKTLTMSEIGGMIALKKVDTASSAGDLWVVTGPVEVV